MFKETSMSASMKQQSAYTATRYRGSASRARWAHSVPRGGQRGLALIAVLLLVLVSLAIGLLSATSSRTELRIAHNDVLDKRALAIGEAGLSHAKQLLANHGVFNDELAVNAAGACAGLTAYGVGNGASGLSNLTLAKLPTNSDNLCYRFAAFGGGAATDGYYVRVEDNNDETTLCDQTQSPPPACALSDVDNII